MNMRLMKLRIGVMVMSLLMIVMMSVSLIRVRGMICRTMLLKFDIGQLLAGGSGQHDIKLGGLKALFVYFRRLEPVAVERQPAQFLPQNVQVEAQVEQRPNHHIAADAGEAVKVEDFHGAIINQGGGVSQFWAVRDFSLRSK